MTRDEAEELRALARELDQRAFSYAKNIQHLDLARARKLRDLAGRLRFVVAAGEEGPEDAALRREVLGLRLEAMSELLGEPAVAPPIGAAPASERAASGDVVPIGRVRPRR